MHDQQRPYPINILFEEQVTLSDGRTKPHLVLLQLTSESLFIRPLNTIQVSSLNNGDSQMIAPRNVTIGRHPTTHSLGFSIKGGSDTGFPVLISRVIDSNTHLLNIGDVILSINNEDIADLTHDQVITKLHNAPGDQVNLAIKYMSDIAAYLHLTSSQLKSTFSIEKKNLTISRRSSVEVRPDQSRMLAEYHTNTKQKRWSLVLSDQEKINNDLTINYANSQEYSLLYAYVSQYINGTDKLRFNSFQVHTHNGSQTGILIMNTLIQQNMWISRINMVIRNLTTRTLAELNRTLLSCEQVFYASWAYIRIISLNQKRLPEWKAVFIVFKGSDFYIFDDNKSPPLCAYDFIRCTHVYPIVEVFIEAVSLNCCVGDRRHCFTLRLPDDLTNECRYLNFEKKNEYEDFVSNYQRSLYISVYSRQNRTFGCMYQGQICRLIIDINKGFEMYNNETNVILWTFTFEQLQSSSDNGRDKIYFQFKRYPMLNEHETTIHIEVQCQHLRILIHVINAFLTIKFIGQQDDVAN